MKGKGKLGYIVLRNRLSIKNYLANQYQALTVRETTVLDPSSVFLKHECTQGVLGLKTQHKMTHILLNC